MKQGNYPNGRLRRVNCLLGLLIALAPAPAFAQVAQGPDAPGNVDPTRPLRIGVVLDDDSSRLEPLLGGLEAELEALSSNGARTLQWPAAKRVAGDGSLASAREHVQALLADPEVDLVVGFGVLASQALLETRRLPKPAVAPFALRDAAPGSPGENDPQLGPIVWKLDFARDFSALDQLGVAGKVAWLGSRELSQLPGLADALQQAATQHGREVNLVPADRDVSAAVAAIPTDAAVVYVGPNPQWSAAQVQELAARLIERRLPSLAWLGEPMVERGILAGLGTSDDSQRLIRRLALNLRAIAEGGVPAEQRRVFARDSRWTINQETARALGQPLRWSLLIDARVLHPQRQSNGQPLDLGAAVNVALKQNLDLAALGRQIAAGAENVNLARSNLLPHVDASLAGVMVDADRTGLGRAERTAQWSASATIPLYSEPAWANLTIQRELQQAQGDQGELGRLDVASNAARAYLGLLGAQTAERVQRQQLTATHEHLELAKVRVATGVANPAEVARWESQVAAARRTVIDAVAQRNLAEMQLNQLLNRPLEAPIATREARLDEVQLLAAKPLFRSYLDSTRHSKLLREFLVDEALEAAPEVAALNHSIAAKQRQLLSSERSYYAPSVALFGGVTHRFAQGGEGSERAELPPLPGGGELPVPSPNALDWQVGVSASLPLYEGGRRSAAIEKNRQELLQLQLQKRSLQRLIDQRVRAALHRAGASFAAITLAREAQTAAEKNLTIVSDGYARGAANIVQLLDAQSQAQTAQLAAASAIYTYLLDGVEVERAAGRLAASYSDPDAQRFFERLATYSSRSPARSIQSPARPPSPNAP